MPHHWLSYTSYSVHLDGSAMTADETEFLLAIASYQKRFGRRYPTWLEVLHVALCLGYRKVAEPVPISGPVPPDQANPGREVGVKGGPPPG
jgi:hypothetical protein